MAKVTVTVLGSENPVVLDDVDTVADVKAAMETPNHTATVGGEPADDDETLYDGDFVDLAPSVKGGR
jgi:hypothetical protein